MEALKEEITTFRIAFCQGVLRVYDYFESTDFLFICLERHICYSEEGKVNDELSPVSLHQYLK